MRLILQKCISLAVFILVFTKQAGSRNLKEEETSYLEDFAERQNVAISSHLSSIITTSSESSITKTLTTMYQVTPPNATLGIIVQTQSCNYWLEHINHQGISASHSNSSYQVFRNVKDFGAKGDGQTDDTIAINAAISSGNRCVPGKCASSTLTPALVYFPAGTYMISAPIIDYYYTSLVGNPICIPKLKATSNFTGQWMIDGNVYLNESTTAYRTTDLFWRQIRNFEIDTTAVDPGRSFTAIHWPAAQGSSLQNLRFFLAFSGWKGHTGVYIASGSGGLLVDLHFYNGHICGNFGNQQFTARNMSFTDCNIGIKQDWNWGWTYQNIRMSLCGLGFDIGTEKNGFHAAGSVNIIDSTFTHCVSALNTTITKGPPGSVLTPSLVFENIVFDHTRRFVETASGVVHLGTMWYENVTAWMQGNVYSPSRAVVNGTTKPIARPAGLLRKGYESDGILANTRFYAREKPQYEYTPLASFISARSQGAKGDGKTDDTKALQDAIWFANINNKIIYIDAGTYKITKTLFVPSGSVIVGEAYPVIIASGNDYFTDVNNPRVVVQVGNAGDVGRVEWSDMIVSTQGPQAGAILIQWNLASPSNNPSGMWDVHTRVGGFAGSDLQVSQCPVTAKSNASTEGVVSSCIASFLSMHLSQSSSGLYMENNWFWVADHDIEDPTLQQISIYAGRGMLVESTEGNIWMYASSVEHHALYQYQLINTKNIYMGFIQTEAAYWQPNPPAPCPFPTNTSWHDPIFTSDDSVGLGLRVVNSSDVYVYGAGLYAFFKNNDLTCSGQGITGPKCVDVAMSTENVTRFGVYGLSTVGARVLWKHDGLEKATFDNNLDGFVATAAMIRV